MTSSQARQFILVTGPARSGKSEWAETLATGTGKQVVYVATAATDPTDREWHNRIVLHQRRRPPTWKTLEVPISLAATIDLYGPNSCLLIDSVGTWLANLLHQDDVSWNQTQQAMISSLQRTAADVILVAEETGWGLVPAYPIGRLFRDRLGKLVRHIAAVAHPVYLVTAGHVLNLSQLGTPLSGAIGR
ncbi:MAG: bifunctional adenosylcobinamide kinase/adenosylcobinamide-phosphate guanylyltransferase [Hormoscilla sp. GM7CHS1pb]|nr:bifunctional adenosylcobinamide kinase/adenosylcobinamide-phosphate guanylyltransferase [Hormoscilla sp. GM7CHS1pb]